MTVVALLLYIVLVALLGYLAIWIMGKLAPTHPQIIDNIVWVIVVLCIALVVLQALGVLGAGPRVPHLDAR